MNKAKRWLGVALIAAIVGGMAGAAVDTFKIATHNIYFGLKDTNDKNFYFNNAAGTPGNPTIRMHAGQLQFANDGVTFNAFSAGIPSGAIIEWGAQAAPVGWVLTDGTAYSRTGTTGPLFQAIGTTWGIGDGSTTFNVPDLRGLITRVPDPAGMFDSEVTSRLNYSNGVFSGTFTITATSNNNDFLTGLSAGDCANLAVGQGISGGDLQANTFITAVDCTIPQATINLPALSSTVGETLTVTNGSGGGFGSNHYAGSYETWYTGQHQHSITGYFNGGTAGVAESGSVLNTLFTNGMVNGNPGGETVPFNIYVWKIIKL